ncbi:Ricin B lectin (fragment) [Crenothrix polyspora]|uniref:Ricin B lectin n=1 Tax=Crenothrix polyspora TaxID=360316 RepID=A0A1R4GZF5_9GAMM
MKNIVSIATMTVVVNFGLLLSTSAEAAIFTNGGGGLPYSGYVCMDVRGGSTVPSTAVQAYDCHGWSNQQWTMQGFTIYGIGSTGSAQNCLDVFGGGTAAGTPVTIYPCSGNTAQRWYFHNGRLINPISNKCLDAGNRANGTQLVINVCNGASSQQWQIK